MAELTKEALTGWLESVMAWPDLEENGGGSRLGRIFLWASKSEPNLKGADTLWEHKLIRQDDDWPSASSLAEEAWGVCEDKEAHLWRVVKGRATLIGGGEAPSKRWTGPGVEATPEEERAAEEAQARAVVSGQVQRVQRTGEMGDVLGAVGELVSSLKDVGHMFAEFARTQNTALVNREKLLMGMMGTVQYLSGEVTGARGEALEAQAELLASTRSEAALTQQLQQESELSTTLAKAAGAGANVLVGAISDSDGMRKRVLSGLANATPEQLAELLKTPEAQRLLARVGQGGT